MGRLIIRNPSNSGIRKEFLIIKNRSNTGTFLVLLREKKKKNFFFVELIISFLLLYKEMKLCLLKKANFVMSWLQEPIHRIEPLRASWHNRLGKVGT